MYKYIIYEILLVFLISVNCAISQGDANRILTNANNHFFIENKGQWQDDVLFLCKTPGLNTWIKKDGFIFDYYKIDNSNSKVNINEDNIECSSIRDSIFSKIFINHTPKDFNILKHVIEMNFLGNNSLNITSQGLKKSDTYYNFFLGNDPLKWANHVNLYEEIIVKNIIEKVDIKCYIENNDFRYDFILNTGSDVKNIKFSFNGVDTYKVNEEGELVINSRFGELKHTKLTTYQQNEITDNNSNNNRKIIKSRFLFNSDSTISFELSDYDYSKPLIIDPLVYSTFLGDTAYDRAETIALDDENNAIISGLTHSILFPTTTGAYDENFHFFSDVFVSKLDTIASKLIFSTFIGGQSLDEAYSMNIDDLNNIYLTGNTWSPDYPTTPNTFDNEYNGGTDIFVTKLNSDGTDLIYSTYIGGKDTDIGFAITIDDFYSSYITGMSQSTDYPTTVFAYDTTYNSGYSDIVVTKLNTEGSMIDYSTYIGGSEGDYGYSIILDNQKNAYVTGQTMSGDFPVTANIIQDTMSGGFWDACVFKLDSSGSSLQYSTYLGGSSDEAGISLQIDDNQNLYIAGFTKSFDFPITQNVFSNISSGFNDIFITKINSSASSILFSTFLGGSSDDFVYALVLDTAKNIYITGATASDNFPVTVNAYNEIYNGGNYDVFISKLNPQCSELLYSSFLGGSLFDCACSIVLDSNENIYLTGNTYSNDFPVTEDVICDFYHKNSDIFVTKLEKPISLTYLPFNERINKDESNFMVIPNPVDGFSTIKLNLNQEEFITIKLFSLTGKMIKEVFKGYLNPGYNDIILSTANLNSGEYNLVISSNSGIIVKQIIVLH